MSRLRNLVIVILAALNCAAAPALSFRDFVKQFAAEYGTLEVPGFTLDYREYFTAIPSAEQLEKQKRFFENEKSGLNVYKRDALKREERLEYDQLAYEIEFNLRRIRLETEWVKNGRKVPLSGLHELPDYKEWYSFFIKKFTSLDMSAEQVFELGKNEVARVQKEILAIRMSLGFADSAKFYTRLQDEHFYLKDKQQIIAEFERIDSTVRKHLPGFTGNIVVPPVYAMEWPGAGPATPPGIYLSSRDNAYGKDVFQFNFYSGKYTKRAMEWLYMHEAIPGHHLQSSQRIKSKIISPLSELFLYPGNFEGWACYVEYFGKDLGLFKDPYSYLGKWEWDLVRSARLVMDAGIHYYGWTHEEALAYWKATIPGQDAIAEREVTRVTNWTAQALSYKAGADYIFRLKEKWLAAYSGKTLADFNRVFLEAGAVPLTVIERNII